MMKFELRADFDVNLYSHTEDPAESKIVYADKVSVVINGEPDKDNEIQYAYYFTAKFIDDDATSKMRERDDSCNIIYRYRDIMGLSMDHFTESNTNKIKELLLKKAYDGILNFYRDIIYPNYGIFIILEDVGKVFLKEYRIFEGKISVNGGQIDIRLVLDNSKYEKGTYDIYAYANDNYYGIMEKKKISTIDILNNSLSCYAITMYMKYLLENNDFDSRIKIEVIDPIEEKK